MIGSMVSELLCRWIHKFQDVEWLVLRDDVMLMGDELDDGVIKRTIEVYGLVLKDSGMVKTVGTFLRRTSCAERRECRLGVLYVKILCQHLGRAYALY